jgi:hypothetical protein
MNTKDECADQHENESNENAFSESRLKALNFSLEYPEHFVPEMRTARRVHVAVWINKPSGMWPGVAHAVGLRTTFVIRGSATYCVVVPNPER